MLTFEAFNKIKKMLHAICKWIYIFGTSFTSTLSAGINSNFKKNLSAKKTTTYHIQMNDLNSHYILFFVITRG